MDWWRSGKKLLTNPTRIRRNRDEKKRNWSSGTIRGSLPCSLGFRIKNQDKK
jgi:hypothetical protein